MMPISMETTNVELLNALTEDKKRAFSSQESQVSRLK